MSTSKSRRVYERIDLHGREGDRFVTFTMNDDDTGDALSRIRITAGDWRDFGKPDKLTVTIEPGDLLN